MEKVSIFIVNKVEKILDVLCQLPEHSIIILTSQSEAALYSTHFNQNNKIKLVGADIYNLVKITAIVQNISLQSNIENIVAVEEMLLRTAALLRDKFFVKGMSFKEINKFRNKFEMKKVLVGSGVNIAAFEMYENELQAENFFNRHKKIVIKPVLGAGSTDTHIINSLTELKSTIGRLNPFNKYILESFINGNLYHCDSVVKNGEILFTNVMSYLSLTIDFKKNNFLAAVSEDDEITLGEIRKTIEEIIKSFKVVNAVTHTEVFVDENKKVTFCEIAHRPGGTAVSEAVQELFGVNLFSLDVLLQMGYDIPKPSFSKEKGGWIIAYPKAGRIKNISSEEDFHKYAWLKYVKIYNKIGDVISSSKHSGDAMAKFVVTGESKNAVILICQKVMEEFTVVYQ